MFRLIRFIFSLFFLSAVLGALAVSGLLVQAGARGPLAETRLVVIAPGTGTANIGAALVKDGVVMNTPVFWAAVARRGALGQMKAGEYQFDPGISAFAALDKMVRGEIYRRKLTVPEGFTVAEILSLLQAADGLVGEVAAPPQEGRLLPETYLYAWGDTRQSIINRMVQAMDAQLDKMWGARPAGFPLASKLEVLTLASIVEKETGKAEERPLVAAVFFNRLKAGMKLQSDPTVIYAVTKGEAPLDRSLTTADLDDASSPYNTYTHDGLPPGPIANPGVAALRAVFAPAQSDAYYFVADGTGGHAFARNLREHNNNVARWRAAQKAALKKQGEGK